MDNTILGHDFLVYWNPDVDWQEGVSNLQTNSSQRLCPGVGLNIFSNV
ncbi:hypothetical protein VP01_733g2 [Puccinia sorghi]|uniref:Uncharacterized protein n=1 Tax=Puccinia sorghi TaxID=27349 RepID=A0A0L6UDQ3_9BASI|nr:hypothetical protein VP01_733g2 [Puccinia sorghi]